MKPEEKKAKSERVTKLTEERNELLAKAEKKRMQIIKLQKELGIL